MDLDHGREGTEPRAVLGSTARPRSADLSLGMWMSVSPAGGLGEVDCFQTVTGRAGATSKAISKSGGTQTGLGWRGCLLLGHWAVRTPGGTWLLGPGAEVCVGLFQDPWDLRQEFLLSSPCASKPVH